MAESIHYGSGTTPKSGDTKWVLMAKWLKAVQANLGSPNAKNNPTAGDTIRMLEIKIARAKSGT